MREKGKSVSEVVRDIQRSREYERLLRTKLDILLSPAILCAVSLKVSTVNVG